jgi:hypothetical protein
MKALRRVVFATVAALVGASGAVVYFNGRAPVLSTPAVAYEPGALLQALEAVDGQGRVNLEQLKARHAAVDRYVESLAGARPASFATADDRVAFWLNAAHGLALRQLLDARGGDASSLSRWVETWPVQGEYLNRASIERRFLAEAGDPRVWLALFTGAKGRGVLDGAPFDGASLDPQLDDAARRFMRRSQNVRVDGHVVFLSALLREHEEAFLSALPEQRKQLLQVVWAYLPDDCQGTGCVSRGDLDRACGARFDQCSTQWVPVDESLASTH